MAARKKAGRRERRTFSAEFKAEAVRLLQERRALGGSLAQLSRELEVSPEQLRDWARRAGAAANSAGPRLGETLEQENRRLRRELAVARQEQAFAKKVAVYFAKESRGGTP
jgi:transposase